MADYREISLEQFTPHEILVNDSVYTFQSGRGMLTIPMENGVIGGHPVTEENWLAVDVTCLDDRSAVFNWQWHTADGRWCGVKMGVLAGIKTRIALPFSVIRGKTLFLKRTPGKLKSVTEGQPIRLDDAVQFRITSAPSGQCSYTRTRKIRKHAAVRNSKLRESLPGRCLYSTR